TLATVPGCCIWPIGLGYGAGDDHRHFRSAVRRRAAFLVGPLHSAAERSRHPAVVRQLPGHDAGSGAARHQSVLYPPQGVAARALVMELQERLAKAGVVIDEARLMHLAYAPEIAQVMLRRQQAEAIIAARRKIVHGAVSMVEMALRELSEKKVVELDDERKAAMVSNLMTVLCAESEVQPVINTGTLYH